MGTNSPEVQWPTHSSDLTLMDFYFWGFFKNAVYAERSENINELKQKFTKVCINI